MCMQLSARVTSKELENFFGKIGQVREVKMIADKNSRKSKGIAYVEFFDEKSIPGVRSWYLLLVLIIFHWVCIVSRMMIGNGWSSTCV